MRSKTSLFNTYVTLRQEESHSISEARDAIRYEVKRHLDRTERHLLYLKCEQWEQERTLDDMPPEQRDALKRASIRNIRFEVKECPDCGMPAAFGSTYCHVCDTALGVEYKSNVGVSLLQNRMGTHYEYDSQLILNIKRSGNMLRLQPQITPRGLSLGRASATLRPDVDLDPVGASENGVSRQHATIRFERSQRCLTIEDNGSTNGTYVNDVRLPPHEEFIISDGDVIAMGRLTFTAHIQSDEMIRYQRASSV